MLRTSCNDGPCRIGGAAVAAGRRLDLHVPGSPDAVSFVVDDVRVDSVWAEARVRVFGFEEVLGLMKPGDVDTFLDAEVALKPPPGVTGSAVVRSVDRVETSGGSMSLNFIQGLPDDVAGFGGSVSGSVPMPMKSRMAVIGVPVERQPSGLRYRKQYVRPGSGLTFVTANYLVRAVIMQVTTTEAAPADAGQ
jgi:hypothetical protein